MKGSFFSFLFFKPEVGQNTAVRVSPTDSNGVVVVVLLMVVASSLARILEEYSTIRSPSALFLWGVEIRSRLLIPLFRPGSVHSGSTT